MTTPAHTERPSRSVTASFDFDAGEYYHVLRDALWRQPARWLLVLALTLLPVGRQVMRTIEHRDVLSATEMLGNLLPWLLILGFWAVLLPVVLRNAARKARENNPALRGPQGLDVSVAGITVRGVGLVQDLAWDDLVRVAETDRFFLFYYNKQQAHYLPKRVLPAADVEEVRRIVRARAHCRVELRDGERPPVWRRLLR